MRRSLSSVLCGALLATALVALSAPPSMAAAVPVPGDPLTGSGAVSRTVLTSAQLASGAAPAAPVSNDAFTLPANAAAPAHSFEGTLTLNGVAASGSFTTLKDPYGYASTAALKHLPPFSVQLVQNGSHLVPVARGLQYTGSPYWNLAVGAGRAWTESGDGGQTRASLPFAMIERNANCVHNGVLTFLFTGTSVSNVRYQVVNETCEYFQFDLWGQTTATYAPGGVSGAEAVRAAYATEVSGRLPSKPISALATDHPSAGVDLSAFGGGITPSALSTFGFLFEGVNYVGACPTRQGAYPYCSQMLLPSYSTAKSAFGGLALMRLAQKYGPTIAGELVKDHVTEASGTAWNGVTIDHALDMATGNYSSAGYEVDEAGSTMSSFFLAESYADKMTAALSFPHKASPGSIWTYHTSDTFLATRAMDDALKDRAGSGAEIFAMLRDEVLKPAGVGPDALTTLRTGNSASGAAFGGYGMFWTQDDIAKVAKLLTVDDGVANGAQVLHPGLLDATMQRDPADRGVTTTGSVPFRYNNAFWARDFTSADNAAFTTPFSVPFMSGFGGISVALMPNGSSYYAFSDNNEFAWNSVVVQSNKLAPMASGGGTGSCTAGDLLGNGGFETGTAAPWTASAGVIDNRTSLQPPRTGSWKAWLNGFGTANTETLSQTVSIPAGCADAAFTFWLRIDSAENLANVYDTLTLTATPAGGSAATLAQWSNLDEAGYARKSYPLGAYAGQTVTLKFTGSEDYSLQTSFVIDDAATPAAG
ncbi:hypothetical protein JOD62_001289 [Microbacterium keratanolyticum]|uniref:CubicO group peptidase (Beta-lactamase class C family) n=1 Tax=Microbacterium keratanolyticum TaxID=67574 RepID=A0A9W6M7U8_9MICO|nr:hypothetical protein [Microbacterium keratanolyticum]MBM7468741.1 hypothetical protein [Microbacterium keratanolyticum]GLK00817.1 hypothetical protein GCM10017596_05320 [Microbacterium keratanolyticum]